MQPAMLDAIASRRRRAILRMVWDEELAAGEIAAAFDVSWSAISQNLGILQRAGLVIGRRDGTRRLYRADRTALGPLAAVLKNMWTLDLEALKHVAEAEADRKGVRDDRRE